MSLYVPMEVLLPNKHRGSGFFVCAKYKVTRPGDKGDKWEKNMMENESEDNFKDKGWHSDHWEKDDCFVRLWRNQKGLYICSDLGLGDSLLFSNHIILET